MTMTTDQLLNTLAKAIKPVVESIEKSPPVTQNHYDQYMAAIDKVAGQLGKDDRDKNVYIAVGVAFQRAGANKAGVQAALRAMGHL